MHELFLVQDKFLKVATKGLHSSTLGPVWRASFTLEFNYVGRVFVIWMSDSVASAMLVGLPSREDTIKE